MESRRIRQTFLDFFAKNQHKLVPSAPIVVKNDPTLMFTNAGMNQFKDYFLGNQIATDKRIADTQKCLRVSGKHNDLEEVGTDGYHHTMFEMLGNWSFGDYFKEEAIQMAWSLLTEVYQLDPGRLYVSVFGGDDSEGLSKDEESVRFWQKWLPESRILFFGKKDNFWEMGDTGPCGPCSEIHYDSRDEKERKVTSGAALVNAGTPEVMEIWNLVFIQFNRKADGSLEELPAKHIDTGMGFERLTMVLQGKKASYDTDIFKPYIDFISNYTGIPYKSSYLISDKTDLAMRVMADHIRAVCFTIADGSLPSNTGPGYVIRRILRRAVRYYYSFLGQKDPLMFRLVPILIDQMGPFFPELIEQQKLISAVIAEEESNFLKTLEDGLRKLEFIDKKSGSISGKLAFELYDTYGFPFDLTQLIARENGWNTDEKGFEEAMALQKQRSRSDAKKEYSDWTILNEGSPQFVGYDLNEIKGTHLLRWRSFDEKSQRYYQFVFDKTPFYPEGGGQVGDQGFAIFGGQVVDIIDTVKENELILHIAQTMPAKPESEVHLQINTGRRRAIENNHSATHLLHAALRTVLGDHVQQRGSLVEEKHLRFDFSHFQKLDDDTVHQIEHLVNQKIRENIQLQENRSIPIDEAKEAGAMMLFGEKYGEKVRMITFDPMYSIELCGGCHVPHTSRIGWFKITTETAIAAGIRRIEAVTSHVAETFIWNQLKLVQEIRQTLKNPADLIESINHLLDENKNLQKQMIELKEQQAASLKKELLNSIENFGNIHTLVAYVPMDDSRIAKNLIYQLGKEINPAIIFFGLMEKDRPQLMCYISEELVKSNGFNASLWIRQIASSIEGGGGGQPFFATAGGKNPSGLSDAMDRARRLIHEQFINQ